MFATAGYAHNGFCQEGNFQTVGTENFLDHGADQDFVIRSLQAIGVFPVNFQLFIDMGHIAVGIQLATDAAHFFMPHFRFQAIVAQHCNSLFQSGTDIATGTSPVLFLHDLGRGQGLGGNIFRRSLDPEFQFRCTGEGDFFHIVGSKCQTGDFPFCFHGFQGFIGNVFQGLLQQIPGIHEFSIMFQEAGNPQGTNQFAGFRIHMFQVVIHEPVHGQIGHHIHTGIVQRSDAGQYHGRTVGLSGVMVQHGVHVVQQGRNGNFFIRIIPGEVDAHEGHEFDFRMLSQQNL